MQINRPIRERLGGFFYSVPYTCGKARCPRTGKIVKAVTIEVPVHEHNLGIFGLYHGGYS
jgi:hypothetical protein